MVPDPIAAGLEQGWQVIDASTLSADKTLEADVVIVGTGAGGGITAEILSKAGLKVVLLEEGPLKSSRDFKLRESDAYPQLYQESGERQTKDKAISILQGRSVGGSTTVNWTSSFRTPPSTLEVWNKQHGLPDLTVEALAPWFAMAEKRLNIHNWPGEPNRNNDLLRVGTEKLGISWGRINRNVNGCWNLGYCGMGCAVNAKQSMLITTIPAALGQGATLVHRVRVEKLGIEGDKVSTVECHGLDSTGLLPSGRKLSVRARHVVLSAGAIGSPAVLLRSGAPDPFKLLGKRTFLHPVSISISDMPEPVVASAGAPQTVYSDHYLHNGPIDGPIGFKLEVPPIHPMLGATTLTGIGKTHAEWMARFNHMHVQLALMRDGFHPESVGGQVELRSDGTPLLDYPLTDYVWEGLKRSLLVMAELQFAAGATRVLPVHEGAMPYTSWAQAKQAIAALPAEVLRFRVFSAHVMGGCRMGSKPEESVVDSHGRHHQLANLHVIDGSAFPTSIGANPQLSIYGLAARNASKLAETLTGKPAPALA